MNLDSYQWNANISDIKVSKVETPLQITSDLSPIKYTYTEHTVLSYPIPFAHNVSQPKTTCR